MATKRDDLVGPEQWRIGLARRLAALACSLAVLRVIGRAMIKDIVASISADGDRAADYALSVAEAFGAHLAVGALRL